MFFAFLFLFLLSFFRSCFDFLFNGVGAMGSTISRNMPASNPGNNYNLGHSTSVGSVVSAVDLELDDDDYEDDGSFVMGDNSLVDEDSSIPDQASCHALNSSTESVSKHSVRSTNVQGSRMLTNQMPVQQPQFLLSNPNTIAQQDNVVKKRKKKVLSARQQGYAPNNMSSNGGNLSLPRIN